MGFNSAFKELSEFEDTRKDG